VLDLPRSALLATWGNAFLAGRVTAVAAERASPAATSRTP
jgi:hypothetical protein